MFLLSDKRLKLMEQIKCDCDNYFCGKHLNELRSIHVMLKQKKRRTYKNSYKLEKKWLRFKWL